MDASSIIQIALMVLVVILVVIWIVSIIWVIKDASARGVSPVKWGIIALIPYLGAIIYSALRPPMLYSDKQEQEADYMLRQRELMHYGECGRCSYPVESDYIVCPNCGAQLKNVCQRCGKPLNREWNACPWCGTRTPRAVQRQQQQQQAAHAASSRTTRRSRSADVTSRDGADANR